MIQFKKFLLFLLFMILFELQAVESKRVSYLLNKPQCTEKNLKKMELLIAKAAAIGPHGRKLPESAAQVQSFCRETNRIVARVESFLKDCYTKEVRNYANIMIYTIKANLRRFCGKSGSKIVKQYIKLGPCANKYVQPFDGCMVEFINKTKQLIDIEDDRKKIPYTCCYFNKGVKCGEDFLNSIPCIRPYVSDLMDMFRAGSQSSVDLMCGEYNGQTDACERLGPAPKPKIPNKTNYVTFAFVLIDLLDSIKELPASPGLGV